MSEPTLNIFLVPQGEAEINCEQKSSMIKLDIINVLTTSTHLQSGLRQLKMSLSLMFLFKLYTIPPHQFCNEYFDAEDTI